jgi:hypothetical protein
MTTTQLRPLTRYSLDTLASLLIAPMPCYRVNASVVDRLTSERLAEIVWLPSPHEAVQGTVPHVAITKRGKERLREEGKQ